LNLNILIYTFTLTGTLCPSVFPHANAYNWFAPAWPGCKLVSNNMLYVCVTKITLINIDSTA